MRDQNSSTNRILRRFSSLPGTERCARRASSNDLNFCIVISPRPSGQTLLVSSSVLVLQAKRFLQDLCIDAIDRANRVVFHSVERPRRREGNARALDIDIRRLEVIEGNRGAEPAEDVDEVVGLWWT